MDLVFYNSISHRYLIVDLKCSRLVADIDRAKNQIASYKQGYDAKLDYAFQKATIGLILGKEPIDREYFYSTATTENVFYCSFTIQCTLDGTMKKRTKPL